MLIWLVDVIGVCVGMVLVKCFLVFVVLLVLCDLCGFVWGFLLYVCFGWLALRFGFTLFNCLI